MTFDFSTFPRLETDRLVLREMTRRDLDPLFALFRDPEVTRYNDVETFVDRHDAEEIFDWVQDRFRKHIGMRWAITLRSDPSGALIGTCGFNVWLQHNNCAEIGYDLMRAHWGQGLMTEAVGAMLRFGFRAMQLNRIEADVTTGNEASRRVLVKAGFTEEGILRQRGYWKGGYHDLHLYSILRHEYEETVARS